MKHCKDCEYFKIKYEPNGHYDSGQAVCKKHDMVVDYISKRTLNNLTCVEEEGAE